LLDLDIISLSYKLYKELKYFLFFIIMVIIIIALLAGGYYLLKKEGDIREEITGCINRP